MALQGAWQLFPEQAAEVFEALHLTLVLAATVIWLPLSSAKVCEEFSLQPVRVPASLLGSCHLPALPEPGT